MKTNTTNLKRIAAISSFAFFAATCPLAAQTGESSGASQSTEQQSQGIRSGESGVQMDRSDESSGIRIDEPAGATTDAKNWSWIGLLGLAGLFGLKRHHDVRDETHRTARA
jgi:hypothetical protein